MRAAFAIPGDLASPTGGYGYARRFLREAPRLGLEVDVVPLGDGFPHPTGKTLQDCRSALSSVPADKPLMIDGLALGVLPKSVLDAVRAPIVALCHHPLALETGLAPRRVAELSGTERTALGAARHVITTSSATAAILRESYGVPPERLTIARPGTDRCARARGSGAAGCHVLSVGSITPRKGHARLVAALAPLAEHDWRLRIVGPSPDADALAMLKRQIGACGLCRRIEIAGPLSLPALTAAYHTTDLFALASEFEGYGMAFAEAMAHGLPVLGLASPAVSEATLGAARLVRPEEFAEALEELVRDPPARERLAGRCWDAAEHLPQWPETARKIAVVLGSVT